jgi:hypothetical protein
MIIGFTGTQKGMTNLQKAWIKIYLTNHSNEITSVHHGDCIGADKDFDTIAKELNLIRFSHPANNTENKRANCDAEKTYPSKPALERNKDIVNTTDMLLATPGQNKEILRSGTWATIRYALKTYSPAYSVYIIYPNGNLERRLK